MKRFLLLAFMVLAFSSPAAAAPMGVEEFAALTEEQKYEFYVALYKIENAVPEITLPDTVVTVEKDGSVGVRYSTPINVKIDYLEYDINLFPKVVAGNKREFWGLTVGGITISFAFGLVAGGLIGGFIGHGIK